MEIPSPATFLLVWIHFFLVNCFFLLSFFLLSPLSFKFSCYSLNSVLQSGESSTIEQLSQPLVMTNFSLQVLAENSALGYLCLQLWVITWVLISVRTWTLVFVSMDLCPAPTTYTHHHFPLSLLCNLNEVLYRNGWALCEKLKML